MRGREWKETGEEMRGDGDVTDSPSSVLVPVGTCGVALNVPIKTFIPGNVAHFWPSEFFVYACVLPPFILAAFS